MGVFASNQRDGLTLRWSGSKTALDAAYANNVDATFAKIEERSGFTSYIPSHIFYTRPYAIGIWNSAEEPIYNGKLVIVQKHNRSDHVVARFLERGDDNQWKHVSTGPWRKSIDSVIHPLEKATLFDINGDNTIQGFSGNIHLSNVSVKEGEDGYLILTRGSRDGRSHSYADFSIPVTVNLEWKNDSATAGSDWTAGDLQVTFAAGEKVKRIRFQTHLEEDSDAGDESFTVKVTTADSNRLWQNHIIGETPGYQSIVTILDSSTPTYSISPTVSSSNEGGEVRTNVSTTGVAEGTRLYWTISGKGIDANDFSAGSLKGSRLVKSDGSITFAHTLAADQTTEGSETLTIKLYSDWQRTAQVGDAATVTINDTSIQQKSYYSIGDVQGYEGDTLYALVSRTGNVSISHTLSHSASNGTAFSGFDFVAPSSTLSFAAGESSKLVGIRTIEDSLVESDESFTLTLSAISSGAVISEGRATLTIRNAIPIPFKTSISRTPTTLTTPPNTRSMSAM
jgi:hypothetical protein